MGWPGTGVGSVGRARKTTAPRAQLAAGAAVQSLFSRRAHQRDRRTMTSKLWQLRVVPKPQREHVAIAKIEPTRSAGRGRPEGKSDRRNRPLTLGQIDCGPTRYVRLWRARHSSSSSAPLSRSSLATSVKNPTQNLVAAPSLKASMHSFVVRVALRQHVPLRTCIENPQHRFQHMTGRNRLASRTPIGNMLLRKMLPNAFPLFVRQQNHSSFIADRQQQGILR